jgi:hypothetical protein
VAVTFENIKDDFLELKNFVLNDLELIRNAPKGGNYAATLLVVTACEAAGTLRYGKKDGGLDFFRDYLVPKKWRSVSKSIYSALRNGLAHSFVTKAILKATDRPIELGISWSKKNHFEYDSGRTTLFINVQEISKNLREAFEQYEGELRQQAELRDRFITWRKKQRVFEVEDRDEKEAWKVLVK